MFKTLIIIPTYNEADNIASLIQAIFALGLVLDILVVDDNSPDGTGDRVLELQIDYPTLYLLSKDKKDGLGRAYLAGFAWAKTQGYEAVVQMDADWSHSPKELPRLLQALTTHDFVIGSRYVQGGGVVNWPRWRQIVSRGGSLYARLILGLPIKDLTGGFNAWRLTILDKINLPNIRSNGYSFQIELKTKAARVGGHYQETPIIFEERRLGQSKLRGRIIVEAIWRVWQIKWQIMDRKIAAAVLALLILTALVYQPIFQSDWLNNWDDNFQVIDNPDIRMISWSNVKNIFSSFYIGMYQPLTTLIYALEYRWFGLSAPIFHGANLLLHLINILLVYRLAKNILKQRGPVPSEAEGLALALAAIFALHPLQVEAVAWVSASSTLLCSTFILSGVLVYWRYIVLERRRDFWITFALFIAALLAKALAVVFPLLLILMDWYHKKLNQKTLLEKIPFTLVALIFGWIMFAARQNAGHLTSLSGRYAWWEHILIVLSSLFFYIEKLFWPLNLSAFYAYPLKTANLLPLNFYLFPLIILALCAGLLGLKKINRLPRLIVLALGWFIINLILVLKMVPLGAQTMADRYNYLAMLGWLLIIVFSASRLIAAKRTAKKFLLPLLILIIAGLALITRARVTIWRDDLTLINDAVAKTYPDANLYNARAQAKWQADDYQGALNDFDRSLLIDPGNWNAHHNRGVLLYDNFQRYQEALAELNLVIKFRPDSSAYYNRGNIKAALNDLSGAIADYSQALSLGHDWLFYFVRANAHGQLKQYAEALTDYKQVIDLAPDFSSAYYYKGVTLLNLRLNSEACEAWRAGAKMGLKLGPDLVKLCPDQ